MAKRKVTLLLDTRVADALRLAVERGAARSQSALVERAVSEFTAGLRRRRLRESYERAAADPEFLRDLDEIARDFAHADEEL